MGGVPTAATHGTRHPPPATTPTVAGSRAFSCPSPEAVRRAAPGGLKVHQARFEGDRPGRGAFGSFTRFRLAEIVEGPWKGLIDSRTRSKKRAQLPGKPRGAGWPHKANRTYVEVEGMSLRCGRPACRRRLLTIRKTKGWSCGVARAHHPFTSSGIGESFHELNPRRPGISTRPLDADIGP